MEEELNLVVSSVDQESQKEKSQKIQEANIKSADVSKKSTSSLKHEDSQKILMDLYIQRTSQSENLSDQKIYKTYENQQQVYEIQLNHQEQYTKENTTHFNIQTPSQQRKKKKNCKSVTFREYLSFEKPEQSRRIYKSPPLLNTQQEISPPQDNNQPLREVQNVCQNQPRIVNLLSEQDSKNNRMLARRQRIKENYEKENYRYNGLNESKQELQRKSIEKTYKGSNQNQIQEIDSPLFPPVVDFSKYENIEFTPTPIKIDFSSPEDMHNYDDKSPRFQAKNSIQSPNFKQQFTQDCQNYINMEFSQKMNSQDQVVQNSENLYLKQKQIQEIENQLSFEASQQVYIQENVSKPSKQKFNEKQTYEQKLNNSFQKRFDEDESQQNGFLDQDEQDFQDRIQNQRIKMIYVFLLGQFQEKGLELIDFCIKKFLDLLASNQFQSFTNDFVGNIMDEMIIRYYNQADDQQQSLRNLLISDNIRYLLNYLNDKFVEQNQSQGSSIKKPSDNGYERAEQDSVKKIKKR